MINEWLAHIRRTTPEKGVLATQDKQGNSILIDWKRADILSPHLAYFKKNTSELASEEIALAELEFLRAYPDAASQELFLKACEPLLKDGVGSANWAEIEEKIRVAIVQFYSADLSKFGSEIIKPLMDDLYFFGTVKDKEEDQVCGFFIFAITPALPFGNIKVINLVVRSHERDRGLEKAMLRAIFEIIPQTNRIFLFVRPTNVVALEMYKDLGFVANFESFLDPNHKVNTHYLTPLEFTQETLKVGLIN